MLCAFGAAQGAVIGTWFTADALWSWVHWGLAVANVIFGVVVWFDERRRSRREMRVRRGESFEDWRRRMPWNNVAGSAPRWRK